MVKPTYDDIANARDRSGMLPRAIAPLTSGKNPDGTDFELSTELLGDNELAFDGVATIAASAAVNTIVNVDVPLPAKLDPEARYAVSVYNPGAVGVTVRLQNKETLGGAARFPQVLQFTVAAGATSAPQIVQGFLLGESPARLAVSNDALNGASPFNVAVRVRRL